MASLGTPSPSVLLQFKSIAKMERSHQKVSNDLEHGQRDEEKRASVEGAEKENQEAELQEGCAGVCQDYLEASRAAARGRTGKRSCCD